MSKYRIKSNDFGEYNVEEKTRTHTGVRWLTIWNVVDVCPTLEDAKFLYPKATIIDEGFEWFDNLAKKENTPSNFS